MKIGVGKRKGMIIMSWNKGSGFLKNRLDQVNTILEQYKPHILGLSELQVTSNDLPDIIFDNYKLECDNLIITNKTARAGILVHKDLKYSRLNDMEPPNTATVAIEVGLYKQKKLLVSSGTDNGSYFTIKIKILTLLKK